MQETLSHFSGQKTQPVVLIDCAGLLSSHDQIRSQPGLSLCRDVSRVAQILHKDTPTRENCVVAGVEGSDEERIAAVCALSRECPEAALLVVLKNPENAAEALRLGAHEWLPASDLADLDLGKAVGDARARKNFESGLRGRLEALEGELENLRRDSRHVQKTCRQLERTNKKLHSLTFIDELTGLYNRRYILETAAREFEKARRYHMPLSALMLDIDRFKSCNDEHGHRVGDGLLRHFSQLLLRGVRSVDLAGRYGGDEFVVILPHTNEAAAMKIARRLLQLFNVAGFPVGDRELHVTASIGVCDVAYEGIKSAPDLIEAADRALYRVKRAGRNGVASFGEARGGGAYVDISDAFKR